MTKEFVKEFVVRGQLFRFFVEANGEVYFGHYVEDPYEIELRLESTLKEFKYGTAVFMKVKQLLFLWIRKTKPHYFHFSGCDDIKRYLMYQKFAKKIEKEFNYRVVEFKKEFHFYRY